MKIKHLFELIKHQSKVQNQRDPKFDGLKFWHQLKGPLGESKFTATKWKRINRTTYQEVMALPEYLIDGHGEKHIHKKNHFIIQTVRIPTSEPPSLRKIMQVALNIGQYQGKGGRKYLNHRTQLKHYISEAEANLDVTEILSSTDLATILRVVVNPK